MNKRQDVFYKLMAMENKFHTIMKQKIIDQQTNTLSQANQENNVKSFKNMLQYEQPQKVQQNNFITKYNENLMNQRKTSNQEQQSYKQTDIPNLGQTKQFDFRQIKIKTVTLRQQQNQTAKKSQNQTKRRLDSVNSLAQNQKSVFNFTIEQIQSKTKTPKQQNNNFKQHKRRITEDINLNKDISEKKIIHKKLSIYELKLNSQSSQHLFQGISKHQKNRKSQDFNGLRDFSLKHDNLDDDEFCEYTVNQKFKVF